MRILLIISFLFSFYGQMSAQQDSTATNLPEATNSSSAVSGDTIVLNENYAASFLRPRIAMRGDVVVVDADSIHLVNNKRFLFYEELRGVIRAEDNCNDQIQDVIQKYEATLNSNQEDFNKLLENSNKTSDLTARLLETTELSLNNTKTLLNETQTSLTYANDLLKEANKARKASRRKNVWEKALIGAGAAAVGVLTGVLIAR